MEYLGDRRFILVYKTGFVRMVLLVFIFFLVCPIALIPGEFPPLMSVPVPLPF